MMTCRICRLNVIKWHKTAECVGPTHIVNRAEQICSFTGAGHVNGSNLEFVLQPHGLTAKTTRMPHRKAARVTQAKVCAVIWGGQAIGVLWKLQEDTDNGQNKLDREISENTRRNGALRTYFISEETPRPILSFHFFDMLHPPLEKNKRQTEMDVFCSCVEVEVYTTCSRLLECILWCNILINEVIRALILVLCTVCVGVISSLICVNI